MPSTLICASYGPIIKLVVKVLTSRMLTDIIFARQSLSPEILIQGESHTDLPLMRSFCDHTVASRHQQNNSFHWIVYAAFFVPKRFSLCQNRRNSWPSLKRPHIKPNLLKLLPNPYSLLYFQHTKVTMLKCIFQN